MADTTAPSATSALPVVNGTFPTDDAAGNTVTAVAEADKISAGMNTAHEAEQLLTCISR
jgi:ubiquitin-like 1-activating enzyme E1 A